MSEVTPPEPPARDTEYRVKMMDPYDADVYYHTVMARSPADACYVAEGETRDCSMGDVEEVG